eukprot:3936106-Rhodomonas_salina.1
MTNASQLTPHHTCSPATVTPPLACLSAGPGDRSGPRGLSGLSTLPAAAGQHFGFPDPRAGLRRVSESDSATRTAESRLGQPEGNSTTTITITLGIWYPRDFRFKATTYGNCGTPSLYQSIRETIGQ